ncbi:hypothetical protein DID76_02005 [Candidatus Marinamargulisbacteria bacterium SCGC AG-414-C22]|nr:hypothetical protein DID76_02005 [Candidatus Marinamargulisbacteria bacterium SCGC AG-414-C22]
MKQWKHLPDSHLLYKGFRSIQNLVHFKMEKHYDQAIKDWHQDIGDYVTADLPGLFFLSTQRSYHVSHPEASKAILSSQLECFNHKPKYPYDQARILWGEGTITAGGDLWKKRRHFIQPAFHHDALKKVVSHIESGTSDFIVRFKDVFNNQATIDVVPLMKEVSSDIMCRALFGFNHIDDSRRILEPYSFFDANVLYQPPLWFPSKRNRRIKHLKKLAIHDMNTIINERLSNPGEHYDLLSMLLFTKDKDTGECMTPKEVLDEMSTLIFAGADTISSTLPWVFHFLTENKHVKDKLLDEIRSTQLTSFSYDNLTQFPYTKMVIQETLRRHPVVPAAIRGIDRDTTIEGYDFHKGSFVSLYYVFLHHHPDFWEDPFMFNPERFSDENFKKMHRFAWVPFSAGKRTCAGMNFAYLEMVAILYVLLNEYDFDYDLSAPIETNTAGFVWGPKTLPLTFKKI